MTEVHKRPPLERATWQRSVGAVLMREIFEQPFRDEFFITAKQHETVKEQANKLFKDPDTKVPLLWAYAYSYVSEVLEEIRFSAIKNNPALQMPRDSVVSEQLKKYTYVKWGLNDTVTEALASISHFPLSLARSVCNQAGDMEGADVDKFSPRSLSGIAELLDSSDFRLMIDQSLVTNNGAWRGFSTGHLADLSTSVLSSGYDSYEFSGDTVNYSTAALKRLRFPARTNNSISTPDSERYTIGDMTTSGCPARHLRPRFNDGLFDDAIPELEVLFGKDIDELTNYSPDSVVQLGVTLIVDVLRRVSKRVDELIAEEEASMKKHILAMGTDPENTESRDWTERALYSSYM